MSEARATQRTETRIAVKPKIGRPSKYSEAIAEEIVTRLANGEPLAVICRDAHMPGVTTVWEWEKKDPNLSEAIAQARVSGFEYIAWRGRLTLRGKDVTEGGESTGDIQRDKAIAEYDLKLLAKWDPKRYGDTLKHTGADGGAIQVEDKTSFDMRLLDPTAREQLRLILASAAAKHVESQGTVLEGDYDVTGEDDA